MEAIVKACQSGKVPMNVACIISSDPTAGGIEKARKLQIPARDVSIVDPNNFKGADKKVDPEGFGNALLKELRFRGITVITQNGWLPLTPKQVIDEYRDTIFNQHPSLLPETKGMYGRQTHAAILYLRRATQRDMWTEVVAQRVHEKFDLGAIVGARQVEIQAGDTVDDLQKRALPIEHQLQIDLLKNFAKGNVKGLPPREIAIKPGEEHILFTARQVGRLLYPEG